MLKHKHVLVVEDEVLVAEYLKDVLTDTGIDQISLAHDKGMALEMINSQRFDLVILDIQMDGKKVGIELAHYLNLIGGTPFMFITAHSDKYILSEALETKPKSFISKPFKASDVAAALQIALSASEEEKEVLTFKDGWDIVKVRFDEIHYAESNGNYIHIHTDDKRYVIRYTLDWFMKAAPERTFLRVHRSTIVNLDKTEKLTGNKLFVNGTPIQVSRTYRNDVISRLEV